MGDATSKLTDAFRSASSAFRIENENLIFGDRIGTVFKEIAMVAAIISTVTRFR
jgi:hypothetical protein